LYWLHLDGSEIQRAPITEKPGFVWDLPRGGLREGLEDVLEMRRLAPLFTIEAQVETLHLLDERRKTVVRTRFEQPQAHPARGDSRSADLPTVLWALPVRGYEKPLETLTQVLRTESLEPFEEDEFTLAAAALGLQPGSYSPRLELQLEPTQRSDEALNAILKRLFQVTRQNEEGLRDNFDSEFLHDFRVSVRRTRSALTQLKGVLPPAAVAHFKTEFSWLGQITGPTRDLDVYLLKMPAYRASLPAHLRDDLDPLREFLERHQRSEHRVLIQFFDTQRYRSLLSDWQGFLEQPLPEDPYRPEGATPILDLASRRIWRSSRRVLKKGDAIDPRTPAQALHRLRIECKKLRYLLEFFRSLYPETQMLPLINALKRLQDNLGDFNDLEVQQDTLKQFAQTMLVEKIGTVNSLMAMGRLVERLEHRQVEERQLLHKRFARFSSRRNRQRFKTLFKPPEIRQA
jgi:CHAD domain-containing protein